MELDKAIKERHSARRFSTKKVDWRVLMKIIDVARLAPLAGNIPSLKFMLISDKQKISQLAKASQQDFIASADYVIAVCTDKANIVRSYDERGEIYARQQAGASIQNILLKITELGLATCWIGAFSDEEVKSILKIPDNIDVEALFPIAYEMPPILKQRPKPPLEDNIYFDTWKNKYMKPKAKPEGF